MEVTVNITSEILLLIASIDEFKGRWHALGAIDRDRHTQLKKPQQLRAWDLLHALRAPKCLMPK
jgi:hypothetical protein